MVSDCSSKNLINAEQQNGDAALWANMFQAQTIGKSEGVKEHCVTSKWCRQQKLWG